jgi:hypothetical protein
MVDECLQVLDTLVCLLPFVTCHVNEKEKIIPGGDVPYDLVLPRI